MLHKPTTRKIPKRPESAARPPQSHNIEEKPNFMQKNKNMNSKKMIQDKKLPLISEGKGTRQSQPIKTIPQKVQHLEKIVQKLSGGVGNPQLQQLLLEEIKGIKSQLRQIKEQIGLGGGNGYSHSHKKQESDGNDDYEEENIQNMIPQQENYHTHQKQQAYHHDNQPMPIKNSNRNNQIPNINQQKNNQSQVSQGINKFQNQQNLHQQTQQQYGLYQRQKQMIDIGKIQPYLKEFKIEGSKMLQPYYRGYHKKSSKPVIIKYCAQNQSMDGLVNIYQRLWKNIVKAKKICINKVYDLNQPLASNIIALEMNKFSLAELIKEVPVMQILKQVLRGIQFLHECGFLYRNVHPSHVMMSQDNNIVLLDMKRLKKYIDIKGKHVQIRAAPQEDVDQFISNNKLRSLPEGRKDDLESLGYLALYILEGALPWNIDNMIKVRSKLTLQQLYGKYPNLMQLMVYVHKMKTEEVPNYDELYQLLSS